MNKKTFQHTVSNLSMLENLLEKLSRIPQFSFVKLNNSKDKVSFYWDKTGRIEFYLLDLKTKKLQQITEGELPKTPRSGYIWTRNDNEIIFAKDKDGNEKHDLFSLNITTKEIKQLTNTPNFQEHAVDSSPDGKYLLFRSTRNGQMNLFRLEFSNKEVTELTKFSKPVMGGIKWSPTNDFIIFGYNDSNNIQNLDVWIMRTDGSDQRKLLSQREGSREGVSDISEDGKLLAISSDYKGNIQAGIFNLKTEELTFFGNNNYEEFAVEISKDKKYLIALRNYKATIRPVIYEIDSGEELKLNFPPGLVSGPKLTADGKNLILRLNSSTLPNSLISYNLKSGEITELIPSPINELEQSIFVEDEYIEYNSTNGLTIGAILYKPKNIQKGEKLPALIEVHGGPTAQVLRTFSIFSQILVNKGYVLLRPNFRGSTGYGKQFRELNIKDIGGGDLEDIAAGVEYLKNLEYVDSNRIGIFGASYGGYMTYLATTKKPDLWKLGVASVGITDWKLLYKESMPHFKYYMHSLLGKPEEESKLYKERSPINYTQNLMCPLLIIHGKNDPRCPISQARVFIEKLKENGWKEGKKGNKTYEYVEFDDIGHGGYSDPNFRIRTFKAMLDFLDRRM
ncbi:MAG: prolyl oligopeptidase family serine peptidase [Candidatus Heimdallarchaeaceae archaeon]